MLVSEDEPKWVGRVVSGLETTDQRQPLLDDIDVESYASMVPIDPTEGSVKLMLGR